MTKKFPVVPDIGTRVHRTVDASFLAFGQRWSFRCQNQSAANIAQSCLTYYKAMWEHPKIAPLTRKDIVLDVGAHMGFFAIPISSQVRKVVAFEPAPANYQLLQSNIKRNKVDNVLAMAAAVGDRDGMVDLFLGNTGTTGHSITSPKRGGLSTLVPCFSISRVIRTYSPTVLKLDCEGAEWLILTPDSMPFFKDVRLIVAELHKVRSHHLPSLRMLLKRYGFTIESKSNSWFTKLVAYKF